MTRTTTYTPPRSARPVVEKRSLEYPPQLTRSASAVGVYECTDTVEYAQPHHKLEFKRSDSAMGVYAQPAQAPSEFQRGLVGSGIVLGAPASTLGRAGTSVALERAPTPTGDGAGEEDPEVKAKEKVGVEGGPTKEQKRDRKEREKKEREAVNALEKEAEKKDKRRRSSGSRRAAGAVWMLGRCDIAGAAQAQYFWTNSGKGSTTVLAAGLQRQIDKFEVGVKGYADVKMGWRRRFSAKEGEVEALKVHRRRTPSSYRSSQVRASRTIRTRWRTSSSRGEGRCNEPEERRGDAKWEARVKEYETRLKAAEERVKRERQGGKERVAELESNLKWRGNSRSLQRQFELAQKRNQQLNEVVEATNVSAMTRIRVMAHDRGGRLGLGADSSTPRVNSKLLSAEYVVGNGNVPRESSKSRLRLLSVLSSAGSSVGSRVSSGSSWGGRDKEKKNKEKPKKGSERESRTTSEGRRQTPLSDVFLSLSRSSSGAERAYGGRHGPPTLYCRGGDDGHGDEEGEERGRRGSILWRAAFVKRASARPVSNEQTLGGENAVSRGIMEDMLITHLNIDMTRGMPSSARGAIVPRK
ncbi:hypothetical protein C8R46DRAFT_1281550 [Mycena filopes]|nr:hypothetical protein C8R46DRAFT_1281550 [Mycena filopes]